MLCCMHGVGLKQTILNEPPGPLSADEQDKDDKLNADASCALAPVLFLAGILDLVLVLVFLTKCFLVLVPF